MATLAAGQVLTATLLNSKLRKRIARAKRITNSTVSTSTTYIPVLRLDNVPLQAGRNYSVTWKGHFQVATATDVLSAGLFHATDGTVATTSKSFLPGSTGNVDFAVVQQTPVVTVVVDYSPPVDQYLSLLLAFAHLSGGSGGTSNSFMVANNAGFTTEIYVDDMGDDPGDTGTDL